MHPLRITILLACSAVAVGAGPSDRAAADAHYKEAVELLKQKKVPLAIESLNRAIALQPKHAMSHRALGLAYFLLGKEAKGVEELETFVRLSPRDLNTGKMREFIADYYQRTGQTPPCTPSSAFDASPERAGAQSA